ncbi:hypothetical protein Pla163_26210 [Planctomycetes bacterium Pla163]|uniref:Uncharacterized protein n=1 Tax=Rohdeia mirabilis TaxID=2528008 RepID=A0A518D1Y2_9BACT|nr:hypothetical protein Pla163_26210 [Planctomycetes bacterium Pla163]
MYLRSLTIALAASALLAGTAAAQPISNGHGGHVTLKHGPSSKIVVHQSPCAKVWVPGRHEYRTERYTIPARTQRVWHAAQYRIEYTPCGGAVKVLVAPGHWDVVVVEPARTECRRVKVWVPGHWK